MADRERLYAAILANPDEDTPRLMYADWLDENAGQCPACTDHTGFCWGLVADCRTCLGTGSDGRRERAEFIRVQCEIEAIEREQADLLNDETDWSRCESESGVAASWCPNCGDCVCPEPEDSKNDPACPLHATHSKHCRGDYLRRRLDNLHARERELWGEYHPERPPDASHLIRREVPPEFSLLPATWAKSEHYTGTPLAVVRRGFVDEVRLSAAAFVGGACGCNGSCATCDGSGRTPGLAAGLFRAHPITRGVLADKSPTPKGEPNPMRVVLADKSPTPEGEPNPMWHRRLNVDEADDIDPVLFDILLTLPGRDDHDGWIGYKSSELALDALSEACVIFGRSLVKPTSLTAAVSSGD